ncbi:YhcN/YlaJ family sporulation lipoprotein [Neobacillus sp. SCS-31]|uniref:YhcN/YlaJ family sporulation lipoprotein n=1 Tax=Neobacillus oceani TaxID=3115292 RepID=UPI0039064243
MKRIALVSVALTALVLSACGVNNDGSNDNNRQKANINNVNNDTQGMKVADQIEDKIVSMNEVDQSNVTIKNNNAYVTAQLNNNNNNLSKDVAQKIADLAKSIDPDIENVYISVNPKASANADVYDRMNDLSNDSQWTSN